MDYYFLIITTIDIFVLGIMCILTIYNETMNMRRRYWFIGAFLLIILISILEVVTIAVDNRPAVFRWINVISNYLGFGLTPAVPILLSIALEEDRSTKYAVMIEGAYLLFLAVSFPFRGVFYVDRNNQYMRGEFFWIYLAAYFSAVLYLLAMTLRVTRIYQNRSKNSVYSIAVFLLAGSMVQVLFPHIHVTWLCVTLLSILYYIYCNGMWQQLDELTGLLNQNSYRNQTALLTQKGTLVVFDVDDFKNINDRYGHLMGDRCLEEIAYCIKKAYSKNGFCYRIGGDEFCVLLNADANLERCYRRMIGELEFRRKGLPVLPYVSIGSAPYKAGDDAQKIKEIADANMYQFKKEHKKAGRSRL